MDLHLEVVLLKLQGRAALRFQNFLLYRSFRCYVSTAQQASYSYAVSALERFMMLDLMSSEQTHHQESLVSQEWDC